VFREHVPMWPAIVVTGVIVLGLVALALYRVLAAQRAAAAIERGLRVVYPIRDEPWGVRRFFVEDPSGTIVNVLAHSA
jgi:uncharacterized glyoxalase superfamily protein PhnB